MVTAGGGLLYKYDYDVSHKLLVMSSSVPAHLPSLALCRRCDVGATFDLFEDALKFARDKDWQLKNREDWNPASWDGNEAPECAICMERLNEPGDVGERSKQVEALFENPECGHCFHRNCLVKVIQDNGEHSRCPLCRRPIDKEVVEMVLRQEQQDEPQRRWLSDLESKFSPVSLRYSRIMTTEARENVPLTLQICFDKLQNSIRNLITESVNSLLEYQGSMKFTVMVFHAFAFVTNYNAIMQARSSWGEGRPQMRLLHSIAHEYYETASSTWDDFAAFVQPIGADTPMVLRCVEELLARPEDDESNNRASVRISEIRGSARTLSGVEFDNAHARLKQKFLNYLHEMTKLVEFLSKSRIGRRAIPELTARRVLPSLVAFYNDILDGVEDVADQVASVSGTIFGDNSRTITLQRWLNIVRMLAYDYIMVLRSEFPEVSALLVADSDDQLYQFAPLRYVREDEG